MTAHTRQIIARIAHDAQQRGAHLPTENTRRYDEFYIPKKSGGWRKMSSPHPTLKRLQKRLVKHLSPLYTSNAVSMGFVRGRSVRHNAQAHVGKPYVFCIDLQDFFPNITFPMVRHALQRLPLRLSAQEIEALAGLCCKGNAGSLNTETCYLPQGAPTSPLLSNFVCMDLDNALAELAERYQCTVTRYADDITFSGATDIFSDAQGAFRRELVQQIEAYGFRIKEKKTRLRPQHRRQTVTGVTVNAHPNVPRSYVREIRSLLYIWKQYGYEEAEERYYAVHPKENVRLRDVLHGKIQYIKVLKGKNDSVYRQLSQRYIALQYGKARKSVSTPSPQPADRRRSLYTDESLLTKILRFFGKGK